MIGIATYRENLREYVKRSGLSAAALAEVWGVNRATIYTWLNGTRPIPGPIRFILDKGYAPADSNPDEAAELRFLMNHLITARKWCRIESLHYDDLEVQVRPWERTRVRSIRDLIDCLREVYHKSELETSE